ncbi:hypothetical protein K9M79_02060 [Candidatus Woesearchaeota archaeon]|nr:hypothetical protein [Candidatus Woesearchaeota archaeon]
MKTKKDPEIKEAKIISMGDKRTLYSALLIVAALLVFIYIFRPWFHEFLMVFYRVPMLFISVAFVVAGSIMMIRRSRVTSSVLITIGILLMLVMSFNDLIVQHNIVQSTEYNKIQKLPDSTTLRMLPMPVAYRYLQDSLQKSTERIGGLDIVNINGSLVWTAPRVPDGTILYFTQKVNGLMIGQADVSERKTRLVNSEMEIGEDIGIFDNIFWTIYKKKFFIDVDEVYYLMDGDEVITIVPTIGYRFMFPVMVPYFNGAFKVYKDGSAEFLTPEEIEKDPLFADNVVYPESLARLYVDSYKYHLGIINTWFLHEDQIEISDVYGEANRQPFLIPTEDGLKWIVATEPYGQSYGVFKIFLVDGMSGRIDLLELDDEQTLTGPVRVVSYVKQEFPVIDWATSRVIEPRPYVVEGRLYWMLSITPIDYAGVSYTVFVDSQTNEVLAFKTDEEVQQFVKEGTVVPDTGSEVTLGNESNSILDKIQDIEQKLSELKALIRNS